MSQSVKCSQVLSELDTDLNQHDLMCPNPACANAMALRFERDALKQVIRCQGDLPYSTFERFYDLRCQ